MQERYFQSFEGKGALFHHCIMEKRQRMNPQIMFSELSVKHTMRTFVSSIVSTSCLCRYKHLPYATCNSFLMLNANLSLHIFTQTWPTHITMDSCSYICDLYSFNIFLIQCPDVHKSSNSTKQTP